MIYNKKWKKYGKAENVEKDEVFNIVLDTRDS